MSGYIGNKAVNLSTSGADISGTANLDVVDIDGAVDMASTLAVAGVVTANAGVVVDNFTLDGTTLALSSGDFTVDVAGDIILNADGGDIHLEDGAVRFGSITKDGNDLKFNCPVADGDIKFVGNDNGVGAVTALTLDMSNAGSATFSAPITTIGSAATSTNVELKLNGVASKAQRIAFDEGGTNRWLLGQGAASESSTFELYNAGGVIALSVNRSTNLATFANGISLTDGNLTVASGHGIDFSAQTQSGSTTTAELLDHYETGTFTITVVTTSGSLTVNSSNNTGFYTRIGGIVHVGGRIQFSAASSPSGHIRIRGLPFTQIDTGEDSDLNAVTVNIYSPAVAPTGVFVAEMNDDGTDGILIRDGGSQVNGVTSCADHFDTGSLIGFTATYRHA